MFLNKAVKFFNSKVWNRSWLVVALLLAVGSSLWSFQQNIYSGQTGWKQFIVVTTLLQTVAGYILVNAFAGRKGNIGCKVGLFDATIGAFNYYNNGSPGNMFVSIYSLGLYSVTLFGKKKINDKMKITGINVRQLVVTIITAAFGALLIVLFQDTLIKQGVPLWVVIANIATFIIALVCQYLQVSGIFIAQPLRIIQSSIDICVQLFNVFILGNFAAIIYITKDFMYLTNNIKGIVIWTDAYKSNKKDVVAAV